MWSILKPYKFIFISLQISQYINNNISIILLYTY